MRDWGDTLIPAAQRRERVKLSLGFRFRKTRIGGSGWLPVLLLLATTAVAKADDFTYATNSPDTNTITITGYTGPGGAVTIPSTINGLSVTSIGDQAFEWCTNLTSVTIPDDVTSIGSGAFGCCSNLTSVTFGNSVTSIGEGTFVDCTSLTCVAIPHSVTNIGVYAFGCCTSLTSVTIPDSVSSIRDMTFLGCTSLTSVTIPDSVNTIRDDAFGYCTSLATVMISASVTYLGMEAFDNCTNLTSVYFRGNAPGFNQSVFANDTNVTVYYLPGTTNWGTTFGGQPTALWRPQVSGDGNFGVRANQFGFNVNWASGMILVVEACTNLTDVPLVSAANQHPHWRLIVFQRSRLDKSSPSFLSHHLAVMGAFRR